MKRSAVSCTMIEMDRSRSGSDHRLLIAYLTAAACSVYVVEQFILRLLPVPFIRLGLSYSILLYLLYHKAFWEALLINLTKPLMGGLFTLNIVSPTVFLSLGGGTAAVLVMAMAIRYNIGFTVYGISILGSVTHNLVQLIIVRHLIITTPDVYKLLPILLGIAIISGLIVALAASRLNLFLSRTLKSVGTNCNSPSNR